MDKKPGQDAPLDWVNLSFLALTPVVALAGSVWYAVNYGVTWLEVSNFFFMYWLTGVGITAGYHRYYSHRSYDCSRPLQLVYLIFGAASVENSALNWSADHRYHHRFVDTDQDPYNILRGGLYAHMGWIIRRETRDDETRYKYVPDLLRDPLVMWQQRWYLAIVLLASFVLPTLIGWAGGRPLGGLIFGGFLRVVVVQHMTFFINSLAHLYGSRPYDTANTARDNWMLSPLTFGEGYHNFHHKFQADYRNGIHWYQFDLGKWWIRFFHWMGWAWRLNRTPERLILKAKLEVQMLEIEERLAAARAPERLWQKVQSRLQAGRERVEAAMAQYHQAKLDYKRQGHRWSTDMRRQWEAKVAAYREESVEARRRWRDMMEALNRIPHPSAQSLASFAAVMEVLNKQRPI